MQEVSNNNFGIVIAYLIPGFVALWGISLFSETVRTWLGTPSALAPTVGGFLYVTLASLALGLLVSTLRWGTIDAIHHRTGILDTIERAAGPRRERSTAAHRERRLTAAYQINVDRPTVHLGTEPVQNFGNGTEPHGKCGQIARPLSARKKLQAVTAQSFAKSG